jgi:vacuolar-type H+-ATPase subunit H
MDSLPVQFVNLFASSAIIVFVGYYFFRFNKIEREFEKKEKKADSQYHQVIDDALSRERKIISDTTEEAEHIISEAKYVSSSSKENLEQTLNKTINDIQKEALAMGHTYLDTYASSLKEISEESQNTFQQITKGFEEDLQKQISGFQEVVKGLEQGLQKQIKDFNESLIPKVEKEIEDYKAERLRQTEELVTTITRKASEEILRKSISSEDHQKLIIESLEKAKKEGVLN